MPDFVLNAVIPDEDDPVRIMLKHKKRGDEGELVDHDYIVELHPEMTALGAKVVARFTSDQATKFIEAQVTDEGRKAWNKALRAAPMSNKAIKQIGDDLVKHYLGIESGKSDDSSES